MKCVVCKTEQPPEAKFCSQCGTALSALKRAAPSPQDTKKIPLLPVLGGGALAIAAVGIGAWIILSGSPAPSEPTVGQSLPVAPALPTSAPLTPESSPQLRLVSPSAKTPVPAAAPVSTDADDSANDEDNRSDENRASEEAYVRQMNRRLDEQFKEKHKQQER